MMCPGMLIRHAKARGEWAELRFMTRATELGFRVTKPWGDNAPYDLAIESNGRFFRVQVKCTRQRRWKSYRCHLDSNGHPYRPDQVDFIAAYVIPADTWYILPIRATNGQPEILLNPHRENSRHRQYKEAWHLLKADEIFCPPGCSRRCHSDTRAKRRKEEIRCHPEREIAIRAFESPSGVEG